MAEYDDRGIIIPEDPQNALTVRIDPRSLRMRLVTEGELTQYLDQYESNAPSSLSPMFFNIVASALITLALAWVASPPSGTSVLIFSGAAVALSILTLYFGLLTWRERSTTKRERRRLRDLVDQALGR